MGRIWVRCAAVSLALGAVAGCTGTDRPAPTPTTPSPVPVPSTSAIASATRLACDDGTSGVNPPDASMKRANGLTADGWLDTVLPLPSPAPDSDAVFWKAFLYATRDAQRWTTVIVESPVTARLYYVPFTAWTAQQPGAKLDLAHLASGRTVVSFEFCGQEPQGYTGGILTQGPACVTLTVSAEGRSSVTVRLPLGVPCP